MEISLKEIEELFKDTHCYFWNSWAKIKGSYIVGDPRKITLYTATNHEALKITKLDISNLPLERKIKILELFESRKKGELTIRIR